MERKLNENDIQALAWFLRELMPVGSRYNKVRFNELINFLCVHLDIERSHLIALMARPQR